MIDSNPKIQKSKLLVVDDNPQNLYMLQVLLQGYGYAVETAANGAEALEKARRAPPDMIITDILMPVMDGFTLCREWKKDEQLKHIPFVFYTATYTDPKDEEFALSLGAERFIVKPVEPDVFVGMLREVIREAEEGRLVAPRKPVEEEIVYLKEYNEALIRKLEDKMMQLERANRRLSALYEASTGLASLRPLDELVPHALRTVVEAMGFSNGSFFAYDEARQEFRLQEAVGFPEHLVDTFRRELVLRLGEERGLVGLVGQTRRPLIIADTQADQRWITLDRTIRSALFVPVVYKDRLLGVANFLSTEVGAFVEEDARNLMTLANNLGIAIENASLVDNLRQLGERYRTLLEGTISALATAIEMRDPYTAGHQRRVTQLVCAIAKEMGLPQDKIEELRTAGLIHDVGKISIPAEILNKPGKLNDFQWTLIKTHPQVGYNILKEAKLPWSVAEIVLQHHERLDGSGYPAGLSGEEIMLEARILGVADVVEAMVSHRPYRPAHRLDEALAEISQNKGRLYDPGVVDVCLRLFTEKKFAFE